MALREARENSLKGLMELKATEIITLLFIGGLVLKILFS